MYFTTKKTANNISLFAQNLFISQDMEHFKYKIYVKIIKFQSNLLAYIAKAIIHKLLHFHSVTDSIGLSP